MNKIENEKRIIFEMVALYCKKNKHINEKELCDDCNALYQYAISRLNNCKFGQEKPFCNKCPVHCYKKEMRERIKKVMRFSGPRLVMYHPVLVIKHIFS